MKKIPEKNSENTEEISDDDQYIQKSKTPKKNKLETIKETETPAPVKKKRELSEKQKENFAKLRQYQKEKSEKIKAAKANGTYERGMFDKTKIKKKEQKEVNEIKEEPKPEPEPEPEPSPPEKHYSHRELLKAFGL